MRPIGNILDSVGETPLLDLGSFTAEYGVKLYAKCEFLNPGGSIKDRIAVRIVEEGISRGEIGPDTVVMEATSGNTGIGLAMVCAVRGLKLKIFMPETMSMERRKLLSHLGAELVLTPAEGGMGGAVEEMKREAGERADTFLPSQFENPDNPHAHYDTTGPEIVRSLGRVPDIFVAGIGTGGTLVGTGRYLSETDPRVRIVAVEPEESPWLSRGVSGHHGIEGIGAGFTPAIVEDASDPIDSIVTVSSDEAVSFAKKAAETAGLLVGISSGANICASVEMARRERGRNITIVTVLPDTAERYLSTPLFGHDSR
jgi:cysteine synthase A